MAVGRPRVEIKEFDKSISIEGSPLYPIGIVGFTEKGPINVPTLVTNMQNFQDKFGSLTWNPSNAYVNYLRAALEFYFTVGNQAWFVRGDIAGSQFGYVDIKVAGVASASGFVPAASSLSAFFDSTAAPVSALTGYNLQGEPTGSPTGSYALRVYSVGKGDYASGIGVLAYNKNFFATASAYSSAGGASAGAWSRVPATENYPTTNDQFYLVVYDIANGATLETYLASLNEGAKNTRGENIFAEELINNKSNYIRVKVNNTLLSANIANSAQCAVAAPDFATYFTCAYTPASFFASTLTGYTALTSGYYPTGSVNTSFGNLVDALDTLENTSEYTIRGVYAPGATEDTADGVSVVQKVSTVANTRMDCVGFIDMPRADAQSNVDTRVSAGLNNTYIARYSNWFKYYDYRNDQYLYVPPCVQAVRAHAKTWRDYGFFYAPAGKTRGVLQDVIALDYKYTDGDLDYLYTNQVNPLTRLKNEGNVIWGQKTCYSFASDFRDINIRYTFIYVEQAIAQYARSFIFEFNNAQNRALAKLNITSFLEDLKNQGAIEWFNVVCDASNNTEQVVSNNEFVVDIFIQATKVAEVIKLNFYATRQSIEINRG